ncbi:MAG: hypothetical protein SGPRY_006468 [Prymnesium sp.]
METNGSIKDKVHPNKLPGFAELSAARQHCYASPVIWQAHHSWYHIFLPSWLRLGPRVLVEFSDDFSDADGMMRRVASFLSLSHFNFSTNIAFNTETKRGAFISKVKERKPNVENAEIASMASSLRSRASSEAMQIVQGLMVDSVHNLSRLLKSGRYVLR